MRNSLPGLQAKAIHLGCTVAKQGGHLVITAPDNGTFAHGRTMQTPLDKPNYDFMHEEMDSLEVEDGQEQTMGDVTDAVEAEKAADPDIVDTL